jgi:hypothetical protein
VRVAAEHAAAAQQRHVRCAAVAGAQPVVAAPQRHGRFKAGQGGMLLVEGPLLAVELLLRAFGSARSRGMDRGARLRVMQLLSSRGNGDRQLLRLPGALLLCWRSLLPSRRTCAPQDHPRSSKQRRRATLEPAETLAPTLQRVHGTQPFAAPPATRATRTGPRITSTCPATRICLSLRRTSVRCCGMR